MQKMNEIQTEQAPEILKGLISEKILGLGELVVKEFTAKEREAIISELRIYAGAKNENIPNITIQAWMFLFGAMNISIYEIIKRIRMACLEKKYGVSEFATFVNVDIGEYSKLFTFKKKEILVNDSVTEIYAKHIANRPELQKEKYLIEYFGLNGYRVINDDGNEVEYPKNEFKILQ